MEANPNKLNINAPKGNIVILDGENIFNGSYNTSRIREKVLRPNYDLLVERYALNRHDTVHFFSPNKFIHEDNIEKLRSYFKILSFLGGKGIHIHLNPTGKYGDNQRTDYAIGEFLRLIIKTKFVERIILASDDGGYYSDVCYALDVGIEVVVLEINTASFVWNEDKRIKIEKFPLYEKTSFGS